MACDEKVVSFLTIGNRKKVSPRSRYVFPSEGNKSAEIECHTCDGTSWLYSGSPCCTCWYFWHVAQLLTMFSISLGMLTIMFAVLFY